MKWLAIDYGERRMGLAVGSSETGMAFPRPWIDLLIQPDPIPVLQKMIREEGIKSILLGLPRRTDGKPGHMEVTVNKFADQLRSILQLEVVMRDEAFTSSLAADRTAHFSLKIKKTEKGRADSAAACILLQEHLDDQRTN